MNCNERKNEINIIAKENVRKSPQSVKLMLQRRIKDKRRTLWGQRK